MATATSSTMATTATRAAVRRSASPRRRRSAGSVLGRTLMWLWLLLGLLPLFFMVLTSIKPEEVARTIPPRWLFTPTLENYTQVLSGGAGTSVGFDRLLMNSAAVTIGATLLTVAVALPAAYALSLPYYRARKGMSSWILSTYMFPPIVAVIPIFILAGQVGLIDTYPVLIVPYAAFNLPIAVWILRSTIQQIPYELQEAAMVDGASRVTIVRRIILPLAMPAVATAGILTAVLSWNEFLFSLSLTRAAAKTAPVGIQEFTGMFGTQWGALTAGGTLIVAPILIMTLILRRRIVSGLTFGAVK